MKTTRKIAANGLGQFFVHTYYYDGSVGEDGPFATGEEAAGEIARQEREDTEGWDARAEYEASRGPEFPRGEFAF